MLRFLRTGRKSGRRGDGPISSLIWLAILILILVIIRVHNSG